ncbi:curli production assembly/transport protein CsgG [Microbulbifer sp. OS29]|uniref:Curli production assembly/transport component CsgG n=1 Tax=Microbulbifer okhotskensis TaxID=2926617 RepID=A0A9X2EKF5_9GAMM|nr:CsgG/HfaB family protein [Microbulbifer okhotskensis]MCO1333859.1 curli production assembly/transport protein CsgG [Microbulbifer okhotskensis]
MLSRIFLIGFIFFIGGCGSFENAGEALFGPGEQKATLTDRMSTYADLVSLPLPRGRIVAAVYGFSDQTGQYRPVPSSSFSTAVTQGAAAMLVQVLNESGWFVTLEREGLQNLLTERKIIRAALKEHDENTPAFDLPSLMSANIMLEGGIVGYDTNIKTGGAGARYFGIGISEQYRVDEVTVSLRAVDVRSGRVLSSVLTSKKILSRQVQGDVYTFVEYKRLLEIEAGMTTNDPTQLCVLSAIESAVIHLISQGVNSNLWALEDSSQYPLSVLSEYAGTPIKIL